MHETLLIASVPVTVLIVRVRADLWERPLVQVLAGPNILPCVCAQANILARRCPTVSGSEVYKMAKKFGDLVTIDHVVDLD